MKVAVLFERSGVIRDAFLGEGHEAVSCDLEPTESPGPHIQGDVLKQDWSGYELIIAHPPCTALAVSGNRHYAETITRAVAARLVQIIWQLPVDKLAIENPVGVINRYLPEMPKPYYIQPWQFGHPESKKTGLWTRGLPRLEPTNVLEKPAKGYWENQTPSGQNKLGPSDNRSAIRARTYEGIAKAMAHQWGKEEQTDV